MPSFNPFSEKIRLIQQQSPEALKPAVLPEEPSAPTSIEDVWQNTSQRLLAEEQRKSQDLRNSTAEIAYSRMQWWQSASDIMSPEDAAAIRAMSEERGIDLRTATGSYAKQLLGEYGLTGSVRMFLDHPGLASVVARNILTPGEWWDDAVQLGATEGAFEGFKELGRRTILDPGQSALSAAPATIHSAISGTAELYGVSERGWQRVVDQLGFDPRVRPLSEGFGAITGMAGEEMDLGKIAADTSVLVSEATLQRLSTAMELDPERRTVLTDIGNGIGSFAGLAAVYLANPTAGTLSMLGLGADQQVQLIEEARGRAEAQRALFGDATTDDIIEGLDGVKPDGGEYTLEEDLAIIAGAVSEAAWEHVSGMIPILKTMPNKIRSSLIRFLLSAGGEGFTEGAQLFSQQAIAKYFYDPEMNPFDGVAYEAFIGAFVGGAASLVTGGGATGPVQPKGREAQLLAELERVQEGISRLELARKAAEDTKALRRDPEALREMLRSAGDTEIFIPAEELTALYQEGYISEEDLQAMQVSENVQTMADLGADVSIPASVIISLPDLDFKAVSRHIRTSPAEATIAEIETSLAEQDAEVDRLTQELQTALNTDLDGVDREVRVSKAATELAPQIEAQIISQLQLPKEEAAPVSQLIARRYAVRADDMENMTAPELYRLDAVRFGLEPPTVGPAVEQADVTSPEFQTWFGESKVVDESGAPLVVYHGSTQEFEAFDRSLAGTKRDAGFFGQGIYFTPSEDIANEYADDPLMDEPGVVMPVYVSIQYPFIMDISEAGWGTTRQTLIDMGIQSAVRSDPERYGSYILQNREPAEFSAMLEELGYDGVLVVDEDGTQEVIAFRPEQIKSVDNRGTYDPTSANIYEQSPVSGGFADVGEASPPMSAAPSEEQRTAAMRDTRQGKDIVYQRLSVIVPEALRVAEAPYVVGAPDGRGWDELTSEELTKRGEAVELSQQDLDQIDAEVRKNVSAAAVSAMDTTGFKFQLTPEEINRALQLPLRAQLWYELSAAIFKKRLPSLSSKNFFIFLDLIGATSARTEPYDNLARSLSVLSEYLRGVPVDTDLAMPTAVASALGREGQDVSGLGGNKTGQFSNTFALTAGARTSYPIPVNDVWVGRMFGVTDTQLTQYQSLHEAMALYQIRLAELIRQRGNGGSMVPHQPWHIQARTWVELRATDAGVNTAEAATIEGNDYAAEWPRIVQRLLDAGIDGVSPDGTISEQALMDPKFVDAIRPTVQRFREAPKSTVEFGTLLTTVGKRAADLVAAATAVGDVVTQRNYMKALTGALFESSRKEFKKTGWQMLVRALTGEARNITRIETATGVDPFAVSGTFEGSLSPNIRIPLSDMTDAQIATFHAVVGKAMSQAAMATSQALPADASAAPRDGYVHTSSVYVESVANLTEEQLRAFYDALPDGHEVSIHTTPAGTVIDVNPRFTDEGPIGLQAPDAEAAIDALVGLGFNADKIHVRDTDYRSVYTEASEYDALIRNFEEEIRNEAATKLVDLGVESATAAALVDGSAPIEGTGTDALPSAIRGKARTIQKALGRRLSDFADAATAFNDLAQRLEERWSRDFEKAEGRIRRAGGIVPPVVETAPTTYEQPAWHGSPYTFDRFDITKLGTGEGAQAFGWGLYAADRKGVAGSYRGAGPQGVDLTPIEITAPDGSNDILRATADLAAFLMQPDMSRADPNAALDAAMKDGAFYPLSHAFMQLQRGKSVTEALASVDKEYGHFKRDAVKRAKQLFKDANPKVATSGRLYRVNVPENSELLMWDAPFDEQPKGVQEKILDLQADVNGGKLPIVDDLLQLTLPEAIEELQDFAVAYEEEGGDNPAARPLEAAKQLLENLENGRATLTDIVSVRDAFAAADYKPNPVLGKKLDWFNDPTGYIRPDWKMGGAINGSGIYYSLAKALGSEKAASLALHGAGIQGHRFLDGGSRAAGDGTYNYVVYTDEAIAVLNFEQGPRGAYVPPSPTNPESLIWLSQQKDSTTLLHEAGHMFLFQLVSDASGGSLKSAAQEKHDRMLSSIRGWFSSNAEQAKSDLNRMRSDLKQRIKEEANGSNRRMLEMRLAGLDRVAARIKDGGLSYLKGVADAFMDPTSSNRDVDAEVLFHEIWARGWETYLGEGHAPTAGLRDAFQKFSSWIINVYRSIKRLNVDLSPEIRDVFDRLVASEDAISSELSNRMYKVPPSIIEFATDAELRQLRELVSTAESEAKAKMQTRISDQFKKKQREARASRREQLVEEISAQVASEPVYAAEIISRDGTMPDGREIGSKPMDLAEVEAIVGKVRAKQLQAGVATRGDKGGLAIPASDAAALAGFDSAEDMLRALTDTHTKFDSEVKNRVDDAMKAEFGEDMTPEAMAEHASAAAQNDHFLELQSLQMRILRRLASSVVQKGAVRKAEQLGAPALAEDVAAQKEAQADVDAATGREAAIEAQLAKLQADVARKANISPRRAQAAAKKQVAGLKRGIDPKAIKLAASGFVDALTVAEATPQRYRQMANRLTAKIEKAVAAREYAEAGRLMEQRALLLEVSKLVSEFNSKSGRDVKTWRKRLSRSNKNLSSSYDIDHVNAIRHMLAGFDLSLPAKINFDPAKALLMIKSTEPELYDDLNRAIETWVQRASSLEDGKDRYRQLTTLEFSQLISTAERLLSNSRDANALLQRGVRVKFDEIADEVTAKVDDKRTVLKKEGKAKPIYRGTEGERNVRRGLSSFMSELRRIELWSRAMDNNDPLGPITQYLVRPVMEAIDKYAENRNKPAERLLELLKASDGLLAAKEIKAPELGGWVFRTKGELIHFILHLGNPSNKRKLLLGGARDVNTGREYMWGSEAADGSLNTSAADQFLDRMFSEGIITEADMNFVQGVWDIFEETKVAAQRAHKQMYGYYFQEVEAEPVVTPWGIYRGGYVPAVTDNMMNPDAKRFEDDMISSTSGNSNMFPGAEAGFTKGRAEYNRPMALDLAIIPSHFDRVMKFAYLGPAVRNAARLVKNRRFSAAVARVSPDMIDYSVIPWLQRVATQRVAAPVREAHFVSRVAREIDRRVGVHIMAANIVNAAQQLTGFFPGTLVVGPRHMASAALVWKKDGQSARKYIVGRSSYMANRLTEGANEAMTTVDNILREKGTLSSVRDWAVRYSYFAQQIMQNMIDPTVWLAAERKGMEEIYPRIYEEVMNRTGDEIQAENEATEAVIFYADSVIRDTQTPLRSADVSKIEASTPLARLFLKFYSYFNNMGNLLATEISIARNRTDLNWASRQGRSFYAYLMVIALPSIVAEAMSSWSRGDLDTDDEDELTKEMLEILVGSQFKMLAASVPYAGQVASTVYGKLVTDEVYDDRLSLSAGIGTVESTVSGVVSLLSAAVDPNTDVDTTRAIKTLLQAVGLAFGLPTNWLAKPMSYAAKVQAGEADPDGLVDIIQGILTGRDGTQ